MSRPNRAPLALLFLLVLVAVSAAAPSIEDPTGTSGGELLDVPARNGTRGGGVHRTIRPTETTTTPDPAGVPPGEGGLRSLAGPLLFGGVGLVLLAAGAVAVIRFRSLGDDVDPETFAAEEDDDRDDEEDEKASEDAAAVGRAAGEAADLLAAGAGDAENDVYRAWREMAAGLDVDRPASTTTGEFARAAVGAGMDRDDVADLTRVFEAVRYGNEPVTEDRVARARAALRRIEETYGAPEER